MHNRRRKVLVKPGLQIKLILIFASISCLAVLVETIMIHRSLLEAASGMPNDGDRFLAELPAIVLGNMALSFVLLTSLTVAIGCIVTHRIVGPVYRFEAFLRDVIRGEAGGACRIRERDEFQELCELINRATASSRAEAESGRAKVGGDERVETSPPTRMAS